MNPSQRTNTVTLKVVVELPRPMTRGEVEDYLNDHNFDVTVTATNKAPELTPTIEMKKEPKQEALPMRRARRIGDAPADQAEAAGSPRAKNETPKHTLNTNMKPTRVGKATREKHSRKIANGTKSKKEAKVLKLSSNDAGKIPLRVDSKTVIMVRPDQDPDEVLARYLNRQAS